MPRDIIVAGGGACLWQDLEDIKRKTNGHVPLMIGVNGVGEYLECDHIVSMHANLLPFMKEHAIGNPRTHANALLSSSREDFADYHWSGIPAGGSSGLLAVRVALEFNADRVLLAGVPMDKSGYIDPYRNYEPHTHDVLTPEGIKDGVLRDWKEFWTFALEAGLLDTVWSPSGYTKEICGWPPTA